MRHFILNRIGEPVECDFDEWIRLWREDMRPLARTELPGVTVSTVFLGLDHQYGDGPPVLWETMVFTEGNSTVSGFNEEQWRYTSRESALEGHRRAVAKLGAN
jgi:hypothetical protein